MNAQVTNPLSQEILIVDDNPENLRLLSQILEEEDYKVRISKSGHQALKIIEKKTPDLMLLDIMMPDLDGFEVYEEVKKRIDKPFPVIFISAMNFVKQKLKAFQSGAVDYIEKPFYVEEVKARVKSHLTIEDQKRELELKNLELKKAKEKLKQAERFALIGEITAKVTHEINNPINFISLGAQSMVQESQEVTRMCDQVYNIIKSTANKELLEEIDRAYEQSEFAETKEGLIEISNHVNQGAKRVGKLIGNLKQNLISNAKEKALFNPNKSIEEACEIVEMLSNKNFRMKKDLKAECELLTFEQNFFQILLNIIKNAEEAIPDQGGELTLSSRCKQNLLHITIGDNGQGIKEKEIGKIFAPSYTTKKKQGGTGLGLAITKELLNEVGANFDVESKMGKTRFNLTFDLAR